MLHQGRIVAVDGGRGVIQRRQKVFLDIADIGGVVLHAVHDILNMGVVQLHTGRFLYAAGWIFANRTRRLFGYLRRKTGGNYDAAWRFLGNPGILRKI